VLLTAGTSAADGLEIEEERRLAAASPVEEEFVMPRTMSRTLQHQQGIFDHVSEHIRKDPAQSTRVLEAWIGASEEGA
jgi:flagellar M-ring protein FliF